MKIYELAKQINAKAGDVAKVAKEKFGIDKAGNFTVLTDAQAQELAHHYGAAIEPAAKEDASVRQEPEQVEQARAARAAAAAKRRSMRRQGAPLTAAATADDERKRLAAARASAATAAAGRNAGVSPFVSIARPRPAKPKKPAPKHETPPTEKPVAEKPAVAPVPASAAPAEPVATPAGEVPVKPAEKPTTAPTEKPATPAPAQPRPAASTQPAAAQGGTSQQLAAGAVKLAQHKDKTEKPKQPAGFSFDGFNGGEDGPSVVFHPAEADDYYDDADDDRQGNGNDYDDDGDEELQREYFGGRRLGGSEPSKPHHHRDDSRDMRDSDDRGGRGKSSQHGTQGQAGRGKQQTSQQKQAASGQQQRSGAAAQPSVFPTRPGAAQPSVFPTRSGASNVFPTRPGASSVFPTRPGAPAHQPLAAQRQPMQQGRLQQQGRNQFKDSRNMPNNQRQTQGVKGGKKPIAAPPPPVQNAPILGEKIISLKGPTLIRELAELMEIRPNRLIADLMQEKILVSINQRVEIDMAGRIAAKYGYKVELEKAKRSTERKPEIRRDDEDDDIPEDKPEDMRPRPPVVTFLGHVDHGKTSLLDYIRKTKVAAGEAGGITQHIGAYSVDINDRRITFLDTPGHAAFSAMRARGAKLTDIAVIVIAADDGIMPQTREVIRECRQANVQIMVAINKCDLPAAKPDRIRQQLQGEGLTPEDWGGDIVCCEVSAHTGAGMDNLLEMILLQADVLELQANPSRRADGYVIEAQMERGIGPTATLLVARGTLNVGDIVLIDDNYGRLRALVDDRGSQVKSAGPAQAVRVMGLSGVPEAGASFRVMKSDKRARELAEKFAEERKASELQKAQKSIDLDSILGRLGTQEKKQLSIIVKADTQGTVEAIIDTLKDIRSNKISLEILGSSIGNVTANDVQRAAAGNAMIVGFQVSTESGVAPIATHDGVRIHTFRIIYELFDFVKQSLLDMLDPEYKEVVKGHAQIRQIFDIGKLGKVAGCQLLDGSVIKSAFVRIKRLREVIFQGKIASLKHFKDEVSEVHDMQEFGVSFVDFEDFNEGDVIECYAMEELERTL